MAEFCLLFTSHGRLKVVRSTKCLRVWPTVVGNGQRRNCILMSCWSWECQTRPGAAEVAAIGVVLLDENGVVPGCLAAGVTLAWSSGFWRSFHSHPPAEICAYLNSWGWRKNQRKVTFRVRKLWTISGNRWAAQSFYQFVAVHNTDPNWGNGIQHGRTISENLISNNATNFLLSIRILSYWERYQNVCLWLDIWTDWINWCNLAKFEMSERLIATRCCVEAVLDW